MQPDLPVKRQIEDNISTTNNIGMVCDPGKDKSILIQQSALIPSEHSRKRVYFFFTLELVNALQQ